MGLMTAPARTIAPTVVSFENSLLVKLARRQL